MYNGLFNYRNAYQIAGVTSFKGRLSELFHILSDDVAAGLREANPHEADEVMEAEAVASNYLEQSQSTQALPSVSSAPAQPMTPSAATRAAANPDTPGTKRKASDRVGNSATRTRLQFN
jgi:hypothetical protein